MDFFNKKILIYGFGKTGIASFKYLKKKNHVNIYDDFKIGITNNFKKYLINFKQVLKSKYDFIIISPGINKNTCKLKSYLILNSDKVISELDVFYNAYPNNFTITITGTNGKSTTSKLIYEVLKKSKRDARLTGNIGKPILQEDKIKKHTIFVIEASSYQIEYSKYFRTNYAIILNITPDHLERHGNYKNYFNSKMQLFYSQNKKGLSFFDVNNREIKNKIKINKLNSRVIKVNTNLKKNDIKKIKNSYFNNLNNQKNLAFVFAISKELRLLKKNIFKALNSFKQLKYRQEIIYKNKNVVIINDSKSTSFASSENLLKSYKNIFWIVGGLPKKGDKFLLNKKFFKNITVYVYGKNKTFFKKKFNGKVNYKLISDIKNSVLSIIKDTRITYKKSICVIFSPAAASFDQFKNFEDRGEYFNYIVKKTNFIKKLNEK